MTTLHIPEGSTTISHNEAYLAGKKTYTSIAIPDSVITIRSWALYERGLTHIVIPDSVQHIGVWALGCNPLTHISVTNHAYTKYTCDELLDSFLELLP
jgi:hypothetical protein